MTIHPKFLLFARHPESVKNVVGTFSNALGFEQLSASGGQQAAELQIAIPRFAAIAGIKPVDTLIASSPFERAASVAQSLSDIMAAEMIVEPRLKPIDSGAVSGITEPQARVDAPAFMHMLELYRAGVANSHEIKGYGESLSDFESRIAEALDELIRTERQMIVVIAHRSSITASLIRLARLSLGYPSGFFGYIPLDLGHLTAIHARNTDNLVWLAVNLLPDEVCRRVASYLAENPLKPLYPSVLSDPLP